MADLIGEDYRPSEDEPYMNPRQAEYFRHKLLALAGGDPARARARP